MKIIGAILSILLFCDLALHAQDSISNSKNKAVVYFIRNDLNALLYSFELYNTDNYIGGIKGLNYLKYECDSGNQLFWSAADNTAFLDLTLVSGQTYMIEVKSMIGFLKGRTKLNLVDENHYNFDFFKNRIINKKPIAPTFDEIQKKTIKRKAFISKNLETYYKTKIDVN